jgi:hypothetical protein
MPRLPFVSVTYPFAVPWVTQICARGANRELSQSVQVGHLHRLAGREATAPSPAFRHSLEELDG